MSKRKKDHGFRKPMQRIGEMHKRNKCDMIRAFNHKLEFRDYNKMGMRIKIGEKLHEGEIFIGNISSSFPKSVIENKFTHVVHCIEVPDNMKRKNEAVEELNFFIEDEYKQELWDRMPIVFKFLDDAFSSKKNKKAKVLIHCFGGMSRSVSLCVAYIMFKKKLDFHPVIGAVQFDRTCSSPGGSFPTQLQLFAKNGFKIDQELIKLCRLVCSGKLKLNPYDLIGQRDEVEEEEQEQEAKDKNKKKKNNNNKKIIPVKKEELIDLDKLGLDFETGFNQGKKKKGGRTQKSSKKNYRKRNRRKGKKRKK